MKYELMKEIVSRYPEDVMYPFINLMDAIGFDGIYTLSEELGGTRIYIPRARTIFGNCVAKQIQNDYNGHNWRELCRTYGYCDKTIRKLSDR